MARPVFLISLVAAAALVLSPAASGRTVSSRAGGVTATYRYTGSIGHYRDESLTITGGGSTLYHGPVTYPGTRRSPGCGAHCWPAGDARSPAVQVVDLNRDGAFDVLLNLYTGGAHCCSVVELFAPSTALHGYVEQASRDFGDPGYQLQDPAHDGRHVFVTADDDFAYAFTDFAPRDCRSRSCGSLRVAFAT